MNERISYELIQEKGKTKAHFLNRLDVKITQTTRQIPKNLPRRKKENNDSKETSALSMLISAVFIAAIAYFGYQQLQRFRLENAEPIEAQQLTQPAIQKSLPDTRSNYSCDGRTYCSQMSSCEEAKYFINHCPNTKMDGNHDGIPCQEQHCTSSW